MTDQSSSTLNDTLAANYMLGSLTIRAWSGKKTDRAATSELTSQKGATSDAASVVVKLLAGNDKELKDCIGAYARVRTWFYANSLPWTTADGQQRGDRLVGTTQAMTFLRDFANLKSEAEKARDAFVLAYDSAVTNASVSLGGLYDVTQYPSAQQVKFLFGATLDIAPMPAVGDFDRVSIPGAMARGLKAKYEAKAIKQVESAVADVQQRMLKELERMQLQLGKVVAGESVRLFKSLVTNMRTVTDLARSLGPLDPALSSLADRIDAELLTREVSAYKDNASLARSVAASAAAIAVDVKSMSGITENPTLAASPIAVGVIEGGSGSPAPDTFEFDDEAIFDL